jgi:hypothetical protein
MEPKVMQDVLQLFMIFSFLIFTLILLVVGVIYVNRNAKSIKRQWRATWYFITNTDWLGVFLIVGLVLLFMCKGPILFF